MRRTLFASVVFIVGGVTPGCGGGGSSTPDGGGGTSGSAAGTGGGAAGTTSAAGTSGGAAGTSDGAAGTNGSAAGTNGGAAGTSGAAAGTSGGAAGNGAAMGSNETCTTGAKYGAVNVTQTAFGTMGSAALGAGFTPGPRPAENPDCTKETMGACVIFTCPRAKNPDAGVLLTESAGVVSVTNGAKSIMLSPMADGSYGSAALTPSTPLWAAGDGVAFKAAGDVVPTFTQVVAAPGPAVISMPEVTTQGPQPVDRSKDLTFTWTNGGKSLHEVIMSDETGATDKIDIHCRWDGAAGTGTIPSAALMKISVGMHNVASLLETRKTTTAGDYCVELQLAQINQSPGGQPYGGRFKFQ